MADEPKLTRVLSDLRHGGHALAEDLYKAEPSADALEGVSRLPDVVRNEAVTAASDANTTPFGYLFVDLEDAYPVAHLPVEPASTVVVALKALGSAMVDGPLPDDAATDSTIPPVYTYWGQFIDHDLTANTDRDTTVSITDKELVPLPPSMVLQVLRNLREPSLNLDSVYGEGPFAPEMAESVPYTGPDKIKFQLGQITDVGNTIPPETDVERDLPRVTGGVKARIGDGRNDENLIVAQLHVAFLRFHNAVVDWVLANQPELTTAQARFDRVRDLVRWHYQWLVVHDFLQTVAKAGVANDVLANPNPVFTPRNGTVYMPLEFSVAGFRFGHSMVRAAYDHNRNFGRPGNIQQRATFEQLFEFTGNGTPKPFKGLPSLPGNWPIEWDRFVERTPAFSDRFARKIDTRLAPPLKTLLNEGNDPHLARRIRSIVKRLAVRNLLRGYRLAIPTGQSVADALGVAPLTTAELLSGDNQMVNDALADGGFLDGTPLWFYVLKEAEVKEQGANLGEVGSRVVCETIIGQIRNDPTSYLSQPGPWDPSRGVLFTDGGQIRTISDLLRFAEVLR
ncbi:MAG: heme peroxidase family protein [Actinomycetota bacterium]|nr:heme peroxidase family protein [Actinomycetota bacterium]MDQ4009578.1 heme peroxidase family protein [Actinomycetota bacterium]